MLMMLLRFDEDLLEATVTLCASGRRKGVPSLQIARFHREREQLYAILDPDERNSAFFKLHLDWFQEWGLAGLLTAPVKEFLRLDTTLAVLAFRQARGKNDEGAELYVNEAGQRSGVVALRPERLMSDDACTLWLRHEFSHLHDMVDPAFGYVPSLPATGISASQQRLARERYRLLWDVTIDGRLIRQHGVSIATKAARHAEFARAFNFWPEPKLTDTFESLWNGPAPTHQALAALVADPRDLRQGAGPRPGAACPLCGFPTFHWADAARLLGAAGVRVQAEFPAWNPEQGACGRCLEIYEAVATVPAAVL